MDTSAKRVKIAGAVGAVALLVIFGVVALNNATPAQLAYPDHAEAIIRAENANAPMSQLPDESAIATPHGWVIDSDSPVEGAPEEEVSTSEDMNEEDLEADDDIDSPVMVEQDDETGEKFVAELGEDVITDDDEEDGDETEAVEVAEDGKKKKRTLRCKRRLRKCGTKRQCKRTCGKKCRPVIRRVCRNKKFCRCFCKYKGNKKAAVKCVTYRRKQCRRVRKFLCKRRCRKFCRRVRHCYCCRGPRQVRRRCRKTCRNMLITTKCGRCRCRKLKCYKTCIMLCKK